MINRIASLIAIFFHGAGGAGLVSVSVMIYFLWVTGQPPRGCVIKVRLKATTSV
jgi:hypothetical protein